jgi:hypothetical protein
MSNEPVIEETSETSSAAGRRATRARRKQVTDVGTRLFSTEAAALKLDMSPTALRARMRRCARKENGQIIARLGGGVTGRKIGKTWRVLIAEEAEVAARP